MINFKKEGKTLFSTLLYAALASVILSFILTTLSLAESWIPAFMVLLPAIFLLLLLVRYGDAAANMRKHRAENVYNELKVCQLQGLKSQIDPHFIFNILNTVASLIYLDNKQDAYDYLIKFTQFLRSIISGSDNIYTSLGEELEFVDNYLELEKMRFGEKFTFDISATDQQLLKHSVPRFSIQTYAENAVNQGIIPHSEGGHLKITIYSDNEYIKVHIEERSQGRPAPGMGTTRLKMRIEQTSELYRLLNQINSKPITQRASEISTGEGEGSGTLVEIKIPLSLVADRPL